MSGERPGWNREVDSDYLQMVAQGLMDDFALRIRSPKELSRRYDVDWMGFADGRLDILFRGRFGSYQLLSVGDSKIIFTERKKGIEKRYENTIIAVEKAERFMQRFGKSTFPYDWI